ncbi:type II secretion system protein GspL [Paraglaciecola aestuariivivens]
MEQLVVRLGATPAEPIHWMVWSSHESEIIASGELPDAEHLSSLTERAGRRAVCALVPTSDVLLKWVSLPAKAGRKALAAIPYMLEEEISGDIQQQFFALGPKEGNQQAVAVVAKSKIQSWLNILQQANLHCERMLPDVLALPSSDDSAWSVLAVGEQLLVRQDSWAGLQGEHDWLMQAIKHHAKRHFSQHQTALQIHNYSELDLSALDNVEAHSMPLELPMKVLAQGAETAKFNLLQGEFTVKNQSTGAWKKWRLVASLAAVALLTSLIDKSLQLQSLDAELASIKTQIHSEYQRAFPQGGAYRDIKTTMTRKMNALEQGGANTSFLVLLSQLSQAFESSNVSPQTMRFDSARAELRMQAVAKNFDALDKFKRAAEAQGFSVQQGAINQKDDQVIGTLTIRS